MDLKLNRELYSIVVYPHKESIADVKVLKDLLAAKIGLYASRNSEAHITIMMFWAGLYELECWKKRIEKICRSQRPQEVIFDSLSLSKFSHAIVLLPNDSSRLYLSDLLKIFRQGLKTGHAVNGANAHISIGRELSSAQIDQAEHLYGNIHLEFNCDAIAVRKLNIIKNQFEVISEFKLLGNPLKEEQLLLFK